MIIMVKITMLKDDLEDLTTEILPRGNHIIVNNTTLLMTNQDYSQFLGSFDNIKANIKLIKMEI